MQQVLNFSFRWPQSFSTFKIKHRAGAFRDTTYNMLPHTQESKPSVKPLTRRFHGDVKT